MQNEESNKTGEFVQKNRSVVFIFMGIVIAALIILVVFLSVKDSMLKKGISEVEELHNKFIDLQLDNEYITQEDLDAKEDEINALLAEIESFAAKRGGYPGGRAWSLAGRIYNRKKDWPKSQDAWTQATKAASKTFLAPVAFFNAAAAAEEQGKREEAIALYQSCVSQPLDFPAAPRAQFSIGRINEELGNNEAAIEAYRVILSKWPSIDVWVNLANSRIVVIEVQ